MSTYILDTDIISYLWDSNSTNHKKIVEKISSLKDNDNIGISIITIYEISYGVTSFKDENLKSNFYTALESIKNDSDIHIFSLDLAGADFFSELKQTYKTQIGINQKSVKKNDLDFMIAAIAMSHEATLVSNDKLFEVLSKYTNLKYENWVN